MRVMPLAANASAPSNARHHKPINTSTSAGKINIFKKRIRRRKKKEEEGVRGLRSQVSGVVKHFIVQFTHISLHFATFRYQCGALKCIIECCIEC